jgi:hypothetical protein
MRKVKIFLLNYEIFLPCQDFKEDLSLKGTLTFEVISNFKKVFKLLYKPYDAALTTIKYMYFIVL